MTNIIMKNSKPINRLFNLPSEIVSYIYELARDEAPMKEFIKNYNFNFKLYKCIKERHYKKTSIKIIKDDDKTYKYIINDKDGDINKFIIEVQTEEEYIDYKDNYIKENICYLASDIDDYKRCLKDEYYIGHDYRKGMKKTTIKKLNLLLEIQELVTNEIIYNMLDLETFKHNFLSFHTWTEILNLFDINCIKILEDGEMPNTKKYTPYYLLTSHY